MTGTFTPWLSAHHLWTRHAAGEQPNPTPRSPRLGAHERVLARDTSADGTQCVATDRAIYWRTPDTGRQWSRAGWAAVEQVGWSRATHTMTLMISPAPLELRFTGHSRIAELAAERVAAYHVLSRRVRVTKSCGATVAAVRDPDSGDVTWTVHFDEACDTGDPVVTRAMDAAVNQMRNQTGC